MSAKDYDGNHYEMENVGGILIATSNLKVTHFNNGDKIFEVNSIKSLSEATKDSIPAFCHFKFDKAKTTLYNWYAVNDKRGLLPKDYIIPTNELHSKLYNKFKENPNNTVFSNSEDGIVDAKDYKLFLDKKDVFWASDECNNLSARYFSNSFVSGGCFPKSSYLPIRYIKISNDHITVRSSNNSLGVMITVGEVGQYGIKTYEDGTIEGILDENMQIREYGSLGPYIIIDENRIKIGGFYNKSINYLKDDNTLFIDIYKDTSQKIKLKEIVYSSDRKITTPCINGEEDFRNMVYEDFNGDIQQLVKSEINIARKSILSYEPDYMNQYNNKKNQHSNTVKSNFSKRLKFWQNKTVLKTSDFDELYEDVILYENNKMFSEAIKLLTIHIKYSKSNESLLSSKKHRAKLYYENSEYQKALSDLLECEAMLNNKSYKWTKIGIYSDLEQCYAALGDYTNSKKYKQRSDGTFESRRAELGDSELLRKESERLALLTSGNFDKELEESFNTLLREHLKQKLIGEKVDLTKLIKNQIKKIESDVLRHSMSRDELQYFADFYDKKGEMLSLGLSLGKSMQNGSYSSSKSSMRNIKSNKKVYICSSDKPEKCCKTVVVTSSSPKTSGCCPRTDGNGCSSGHSWYSVGKTGEKTFQCTYCSITVNTDFSPRGGGCCPINGCIGHSWREIN